MKKVIPRYLTETRWDGPRYISFNPLIIGPAVNSSVLPDLTGQVLLEYYFSKCKLVTILNVCSQNSQCVFSKFSMRVLKTQVQYRRCDCIQRCLQLVKAKVTQIQIKIKIQIQIQMNIQIQIQIQMQIQRCFQLVGPVIPGKGDHIRCQHMKGLFPNP